MLADFGDPLGADDYALSVFGGEEPALVVRAVAPAGGTCRGTPCWQARGTRGYAYRDATAPDGLARVRLVAGQEGRAAIRATGRGARLDVPPFPIPTPLRVQLRAADGTCWEARYPAAAVTQDGARLRAGGRP